MNVKRQRIAGMAAFVALSVFLLWHIDYSDMRLAGFRTYPWGYDSLAYKLIVELASENQFYASERTTNAWWLWTQAVPVIAAWGLRPFLGKCVGIVLVGARRLYSRV
jgi:hypothetical protein